MNIVNLRSDTVTTPNKAMREAMSHADVGDDYYRADPTVNALEDRAAELLGKESALLVLSGTMGNLVSLLSLCERGQTIIVGDQSHIQLNEGGNIAAVGGVTLRTTPTQRGLPDVSYLEEIFLPRGNILFAPTAVVCLENTHALSGGRCLNKEQIDTICKTAGRSGVKVHMDGARIFNAAVALNTPASELVRNVDTITFCLSKSLGCPVGSLIAAKKDAIEEARRWRQMVGGGMRQAGVFAAAGLVALDTMIDRLSDDHENAQRLARHLSGFGLPVDAATVETNIVFLEMPKAPEGQRKFVEDLKAQGIIINAIRGHRARFVTHCDINSADINKAAPIIAKVFEESFGKFRTHQSQQGADL